MRHHRIAADDGPNPQEISFLIGWASLNGQSLSTLIGGLVAVVAAACNYSQYLVDAVVAVVEVRLSWSSWVNWQFPDGERTLPLSLDEVGSLGGDRASCPPVPGFEK